MQHLTHSSILALEADSMDVDIHQHAAYQIVFSVQHPFNCIIDDRTYRNIRGFIIAPQVAHNCSNIQGKALIVNIEADASLGKTLENDFLKGGKKQIIRHPTEFFPSLHASTEMSSNEILPALLQELTKRPKEYQIDPRVTKVSSYIRSHIDKKIKPAELAKEVFLSPSRLSAIFKAETGSSLSKFLLWTRLRSAIRKILEEDRTIKEAAMESGFYDPPNFNKYMHEMIGVPPVVLKQNSNIIQLIEQNYH
jgi:AraC-like DNA-binding protein